MRRKLPSTARCTTCARTASVNGSAFATSKPGANSTCTRSGAGARATIVRITAWRSALAPGPLAIAVGAEDAPAIAEDAVDGATVAEAAVAEKAASRSSETGADVFQPFHPDDAGAGARAGPDVEAARASAGSDAGAANTARGRISAMNASILASDASSVIARPTLACAARRVCCSATKAACDFSSVDNRMPPPSAEMRVTHACSAARA